MVHRAGPAAYITKPVCSGAVTAAYPSVASHVGSPGSWRCPTFEIDVDRMDLHWRRPDRQGRLVYSAGGLATEGLAMLPFAATRLPGIGFLIAALILIVSALLLDRFSNRRD